MQTDELEIDSRGGIFNIRAVHTHDPAVRVPGKLTMNFFNGSGQWSSLVVESVFPDGGLIWDSGRISNGEASTQVVDLVFHVGRAVHVKRWRPGAFGIPGDGGGEAFFVLPEYGDVVLDISCLG
ncbi:hypothetical protein WCD74_24540 [Actinomycetospora sp. OC33-EN08]|uniref:Uncharacterized protein n=1 Tax=Actinomycetospora aurantiaca TaxID=3129233 RepID=A0ABU8MUF9_9PSEU